MAVSEKGTGIYQVVYLANGNGSVKNGVAVIAKSYDNAKNIFKDSGTPHDRITSIGCIAESYLIADEYDEYEKLHPVSVTKKGKFIDKTKPENAMKGTK